jgi:hypothetical protein
MKPSSRRGRNLRRSLWLLVLATVLLGAPALAEQRAQRILFLHHSTGQNIWEGGLPSWLARSNTARRTSYTITELAFPKEKPYGWNNYPYDYWNLWVKHAGKKPYQEEPTLEILTTKYDLIIFKHCFPVSGIQEEAGPADVGSEEKRLGNYKLQYLALKKKLRELPRTKFLLWTGAAQVKAETNPEQAARARQFFDWVRRSWDEKGDNIFLWDFYQLETGGGLYLKPENAASSSDSHPGRRFAARVAPLLGQRIVDVLEGRGDTGPITGK